MKIVYSPQARTDLREIKQYIAQTLQNPQAAQKLTDRLIRSVQLLGNQPALGMKLEEKISRNTDYRYFISGNFGIFYVVADDAIRVVRILDLRTDYLRTLLA